LPISTIDILEELDIFDGAMPKSNAQAHPAMRKALRAHFAGSVNALKLYKPVVLRKTHTPDVVTVIWAKHGVWETVDNKTRIEFDGKATSERANLAHDWIMDKRSSFDSCGWQELMPAAKITCKIIDGTHFSIMRKPQVNELGRQIASALHC
jgi:thioesterase domain-containing protein